MQAVNFYLLRHGKTTGLPALNGHTDVDVDPLVQANIVERISAGYAFEHVVSSPLRRCYQVAERIHAQTPILSLDIDPRWQELNFGQFDGVPFDALEKEWSKLESFWAAPSLCPLPGAETLEHGVQRVQQAWHELTDLCRGDCLIVTHGGPIRYVLAEVLHLDWKNPYWYTTLDIAHQSVTHIRLMRAFNQCYFSVKSIGVVLADPA